MLYLGIKGDLPDLSHHTIYLSKDYRRNVREIEEGLVPPGEPSIYVQNACVTDPALAPAGAFSTLYVLVPVGNRVGDGIDWAQQQAGYRALALQQLERLGVHDIERRIVFEKVMTPNDWEVDLNVFRGATFNLSHSLRQMLHRRPRNRFEDLEGVYLVGGGTHPGSGLPVIFESARITSRLLADDLGLHAALAPSLMAAPHLRTRTGGDGMSTLDPVGVVGGGLGGLAAACTLAARGHKRDPVREERLARRQGSANSEEDGFRFDMGPTILTVPGRAAPHLRRGRAGPGRRRWTCAGWTRNGAASSTTAPCST